MAKAKAKRVESDETSDTRPRWRVFPPEIIRTILQFLTEDKYALRACSLTAHDFRHVALSFLGRHLTINNVVRLKECAQLVARGAFQHIRSLDLGTNDGKVLSSEHWTDCLVILGRFAQYRSLDRLWLSGVPFSSARQNRENLIETVTTLGSTVTELGLYGCRFSSYEEMISLIRSFPLCDFLFVRDCVTGRRAANALAGLSEHNLKIKDLQLSSSSSSNDLSIDVSNLIEDAVLDVGSLTSLVCDVETSEGTQRVAAAVSGSPVEQFQVACTEPGGFQAFMDNLSNKWALKSLTIGPQIHETNAEFWEEAFRGLPRLPGVGDVTIIYNYPTAGAFNTDFWRYFDRLLTRKDLFPALKSVDVQPSVRSQPLDPRRWTHLKDSINVIRARELWPRGQPVATRCYRFHAIAATGTSEPGQVDSNQSPAKIRFYSDLNAL